MGPEGGRSVDFGEGEGTILGPAMGPGLTSTSPAIMSKSAMRSGEHEKVTMQSIAVIEMVNVDT
jgi:hypothetical protein